MDLTSSLAIEALADAPDRCAAGSLDRARRLGGGKFVALREPAEAGTPAASSATPEAPSRESPKSAFSRVIARLVAARP